jgi:hypothetical protein
MGTAVRPARHVVALALGIGLVLLGLSSCSSTSSPATSPTATHSPTATALTTCQAIQLTLGIQSEQSGNGNRAYLYQLENNASDACTLEGYPVVRVLNMQLQPLPIPVSQQTSAYLYTNAQPQLVTLASAANAYFVVEWVGAEYGSGTCISAGWVEVILPGNQLPLAFPSPIAVCTGGVAVSPIEPTLTALGY